MTLRLTWDKRKRIKKNRLHRAAFNLAVFFLVVLTILIPLEPASAQSAAATAIADSVPATSGAAAPSSAQNNIHTPTAPTPVAESAPTPGNAAAPKSTPAPDLSASPQLVSVDAAKAPTKADKTSPGAPTKVSKDPLSASALLTTQAGVNPSSQPAKFGSFSQNHLRIDKNTGALNTTFPIVIPPGRNNLQPDLDLVYSSQNSQLRSIFGEGWSVSIPYIERFNKTGINNLYSTSTPNYFISSVDGELATTTASSNYIARTENGAFNKYTFSNNQWIMTDKNGTQFIYGLTANSQQSDPNNSAHVYRWMLEQVKDTNSNSISYSYFKDSGQIYPSSTVYTSNGSAVGIF